VEPLTDGDPASVGGYRLLARCGEGRLGPVYLGRRGDGTLAAVRLVRAWLAGDDAVMGRLADRIARARTVRSDAVAAIIDADLNAVRPWLASHFVTGPSLAQVVRTAGPLGGLAAGLLALRLARVLTDLHARGVVHSDLKPSDVLLSADGPRLVDLGLSGAAATATATQVGMPTGDPGYLAPEQVLGEEPGLVCDVFALASVVVYAARGAGPFDGPDASPLAVARRILGDPPDLHGTPSELAERLVPCFEKLAEHRLTAAALVDRLTGCSYIADAAWPSFYHDLWMREFAI
jgi:eukaryotic-like serine/threonine-protein kinase